MNIDIGCSLKKFKENAITYLNKYNAGKLVTEHIPDNMHHGNHKKAAIYMINDCAIFFGFENSITLENWEGLNTLNSHNESHQKSNTIDSHGKGIKYLTCVCKEIEYFNVKKDGILVRTVGMSEYYKDMQKDNIDIEVLVARHTDEKKYDLNDPEDERKYRKRDVYEVLNSDECKEIKKACKCNFGYIMRFETNINKPDYKAHQNIIEKFKKLRDDDYEDIRKKIYNSGLEVYTIKNGSYYKLVEKDVLKYNKKTCLTTYVKIATTEVRKKNINIGHMYFEELGNSVYKKNLGNSNTSRSDRNNLTLSNSGFCGVNDYDIIVNIYTISDKAYNQSEDSKYYGWLVLQQEDKSELLVNLEPIELPIKNEYGGSYMKNLRIVVKIKDMKYAENDGLKFKSGYTNFVKIIIKTVFPLWKKVFYEKSIPLEGIDSNSILMVCNKTETNTSKVNTNKGSDTSKVNTSKKSNTSKGSTKTNEIVSSSVGSCHSKERRSFSKRTIDRCMERQQHKCANDPNNTDPWFKDYKCLLYIRNDVEEKDQGLFDGASYQCDHKDGNRSNNTYENCQLLCPNCHAVKTKYEREK